MKADKQSGLSNRLMAAILNNKEVDKIPWWRRMWRKGPGAPKIRNRSRYKPHSGDQEKARRLKQITKRMIDGAHV